MARAGTPFLREHYAVRHLGEPLVPNAWLAQYLFYRTHRLGGWAALRCVDAMLWLSGLFIAAVPARLRGERPLAIMAALTVAFVVALPSASIRPQNFAAPAFALTLLLMRNPDRRSLMLSLPLFVLWQNLHPSVSLAVLVIGAVAGSRWILYFSGRGAAPIALSAVCAVACASIFATPAGASIVTLASYNTKASLLVGANEWLPLWVSDNRALFWPVVASALLAGIAVFRQRPPLEEVVPAALLLLMSLVAARFILFYAIAIIPLLARLPLGHVSVVGGMRFIGFGAWAAAIAALLLAPVLIKPELPFPILQQLSGVKGTIYSDPAFGGSIILSKADAKVSYDGRFYLYSQNELASLLQTKTAQSSLDEIEKSYHPKAFALAKFRSAALIQALKTRPQDWLNIYEDRNEALFVRQTGADWPAAVRPEAVARRGEGAQT